MKKLSTILATILVAISANAQLYVCGNGATIAWVPETPLEINAQNDGSYDFSIAELSSFKLSTTKGSWDDFNKGALGVNAEIDNQGTYDLASTTNDIVLPWKGDWNIKVDANLSNITLTTSTPKPTFVALYLRGDMNGWGTDDAWKFQTEDGELYSLTNVEILATQKFKVADANWGSYNFGSMTDITPGDPFTLVKSSNSTDCSLKADFKGNIEFTLSTAEILFIEETDGIESIDVDNTIETEYFTLQGVRVSNPQNGIYIVRKAGKVYKQIIK